MTVDAASVKSDRVYMVTLFQLRGLTWATELKWIREVVPATGINPLPNSSPFVAGMINIRGEIIPVFHMDKILLSHNEASLTEGNGKILLIHDDGKDLGILVDRVLRVETVNSEDLFPLSSVSGGPWKHDFVRLLMKHDSFSEIPLLDVPQLVEHITGGDNVRPRKESLQEGPA
jgi:purine-binding chemotaxis protein CheW